MAAKYDYTTIGAPACGMAGWGCPNTQGGDWWSDGYDTALRYTYFGPNGNDDNNTVEARYTY